MAQYKILHNPRCRKSRETLQLLNEKGIEPEIREYLKEPLNKKELKEILTLLNIPAEKLTRKNEAEFKTHFKGKDLSENEWVEAFVQFPKLIERPVVIKNNKKAVIGRPPENVLELI